MKQVISLDRLRRSKVWYEKPLTIKIHLSFKKSTLIIILLLAAIVYLVTRGQVAALSPSATIKPALSRSANAQTAPALFESNIKGGLSNTPSHQLLDYFDKVNHDRAVAKEKAAKAAKLADELKRAKLEAEKQRAAEAAQAVINSQAVVTPKVYQAPAPVTNCGSDPYMAFIYQHESGCNTGSVNSIGCRGLGQACPGSKLPCGNDWACQDAWFKAYAISTYGSIYNAYLSWLSKSWW